MPEEGFNPFAGTTGLKTDFTGEILDSSEFGTDVDYQHGQQLVALFFVRDIADDDEVKRILSIGNGWEDADDGKRVIKEGGAEDGSDITGFSQSSNYQRWIAAAFAGGGDEFMLSQVEEFGGPWDIRMWYGSTWEFGEIIYRKMNDPKEGEGDATGRLVVPVKFVSAPGEKMTAKKPARVAKKAGGAKAPTAAEKAAAAKAKAAAKKAAPADDDEDPQLAALIALAKAADSHDEFMQSAYEELEDADAYEDQIIDEAWYDQQHG